MTIRPIAVATPPAPVLTRAGYMRSTLDEAFFTQIQEFYRSNASLPEPPSDYIQGPTATPTRITQLHASMVAAIHASLQPEAEAWSGRKLTPTFVYGVRTYLPGAKLTMHRDRERTHIVSAILNVDQKALVAWPLLLQNPESNPAYRNLLMAPGEVLFYEGNRLLHGRPTPFNGTFYANVFVHYALAS